MERRLCLSYVKVTNGESMKYRTEMKWLKCLIFGSLMTLVACVGDSPETTESESTTRVRALGKKPYTQLTPKERAFATRNIWEDPDFAHLKPKELVDGKVPNRLKARPGGTPGTHVVTDDGFDETWEENRRQLVRQGMNEQEAETERADFKEAYFH